MNPLASVHLLALRRQETFETDIAELQTDIMRFMALIGFVLMGIFALVQALPVTPHDPRPVLERKAALARDAAALEAHVQAQLAVLAEIREQIALALQVRRQITVDAQSLAAQLAQAATEAPTLAASLIRSRDELRQIQAQLARENASLAVLRQRTERQRVALRQTGQRVARLAPPPVVPRPAPAPPVAVTAVPHPPPAPAPAPIPEPVPERGFTLKFASETALARLISGDEVQFYALLGKRAWRVRLVGGAVAVRAGKPPSAYYEMAAATVPAAYRQALRRVVAIPGEHAVVWGVVLSEPIVQRIQTRTRGQHTGSLSIQADGDVKLEDPRAPASPG